MTTARQARRRVLAALTLRAGTPLSVARQCKLSLRLVHDLLAELEAAGQVVRSQRQRTYRYAFGDRQLTRFATAWTLRLKAPSPRPTPQRRRLTDAGPVPTP